MPTIAIVVLVLAVLVLAWVLMRGRGAVKGGKAADLDSWQPRTIKPLTKVELKAYVRLKGIAPDCVVLPQVSLSRFIKVKSSLPYGPWFYSVGRRCVDFLICSDKGDVLGVVELVDSKNASKPESRGAQSKEHTLTLASIPVWHIDPEAQGAYDQLYSYIHAELGQYEAKSSHGPEWHSTDIAPRKAGIEVLELDDERWNQPWPTEENRPTAFLDMAETPTTDEDTGAFDQRRAPN
jgi:Protein of unknown function (DUF2726)